MASSIVSEQFTAHDILSNTRDCKQPTASAVGKEKNKKLLLSFRSWALYPSVKARCPSRVEGSAAEDQLHPQRLPASLQNTFNRNGEQRFECGGEEWIASENWECESDGVWGFARHRLQTNRKSHRRQTQTT